MTSKAKTFSDFYPYYLETHTNLTNRRLHVLGTGIALIYLLLSILLSYSILNLLLVVAIGYGFAFAGHALFENNAPCTFQYPLYSVMSNLKMCKEVVTG